MGHRTSVDWYRVSSSDRASDHSTPWVAPIALASGLVYLIWRTTTGEDVHPALFWSLLAVEAFMWLRLALRTAVTWKLTPTQLQPARSIRTVDVIVTAYAEPVDIVRAALIGCRELRYPHRTILVDDRHRDELRDLAAEMDVDYLARPEADNGRTGALNYVLEKTIGEFLLLLDGDQVPLPDAIHRTIGFFDDPRVAVVQTPLEYQNRDSVLHADHNRHERSLTNEVINPGRDELGAAVWEGPAAMLRRDALLDIGGIPTSGTTGELQATVRLQCAGWITRYHAEVIAYGLAAHDLKALLHERARWARGHVAICTTRDNPLWASGLSLKQRMSHVELLSDYFAAVFHLGGLAVLTGSLITGQLPLNADPIEFATLFGLWFVLAAAGRVSLGRGRVQFGESALHSAITFQIHLVAILTAVFGVDRRFEAYSGPRTDHGGLDALRQLSVLAFITLLLESAIALRLLDSLVGTPLPGRIGGLELIGLVVACGTILWFLLRVLGVFVGRRQYRTAHRDSVEMPGILEGRPVKVLDANTRGLSLITPTPVPVGQLVRLGLRVMRVDGSNVDLWFDAVVRSSVPNQHGSRQRLGCQFVGLDELTRDRLVEYLAVVRPFTDLRSGAKTNASV